jgi:DNA-binding NarL/FixJ family response regulator
MAGPLRVYLVEDSPILRRLFTSSLGEVGAEVVGWSADATTALDELRDFRPDVVMIDISLASGSGFDVLRGLQEQEWASRAIKLVLTNHMTQEYRELGFELGAHRYFDKTNETSQAIRFIGSMVDADTRHITRSHHHTAARAHS